jgi:hypothetical protein
MMIFFAICILLLAYWVWVQFPIKPKLTPFFPTTKKRADGNAIRRHQKPPWVLAKPSNFARSFQRPVAEALPIYSMHDLHIGK